MVGPLLVGDGELVDAKLAAAHLSRDLGLDPEPVLAQVEGARDVRPQRLVAGLHVVQRGVEQYVRDEAEKAVSHQMPEEVGSPRPNSTGRSAEIKARLDPGVPDKLMEQVLARLRAGCPMRG
jgi:hypothetical protein